MSITSDTSLIDGISTNTNTLHSSCSLSDSIFEKVVKSNDNSVSRNLPEQTGYEMKQILHASNNKNNIIKILEEQLKTLHQKHKESIDETEAIKFKYNNALSELESIKKILAQCENELQKCECHRKSGTIDKISEDEALADPNLQGIADKIANVQDKVKAVKQIVSDSDMPKNVQDDIDKVDSAYKSLLRQQYDRIEDILMEHSSKLDTIKARICGDDKIDNGGGSKIRFSLPKFPSLLEVHREDSDITGNQVRASLDSAKINLVATLRKTNDILTKEIGDLYDQLKYYKQCFRLGAEEFVEDVIETARHYTKPMQASTSGQQLNRLDMKSLLDMNKFLRDQNKQLNDALTQQNEQPDSQVAVAKHNIQLTEQEEMSIEILIEELKEEIQDLRKELRIREVTIEELETEITALNISLRQLTNEHDSHTQEFEAVVDNNLKLSSDRLDIMKLQIDRISIQKQNTEDLLENAVQEKESLTRNISVMSNTMQQYKNELEVKQAECAKYKEHIQGLEGQIRDFDQILQEKDLQLERQMAKNKNLMFEKDGKYKNSRDEIAKFKEASQKLLVSKGQNEELVKEVEQLNRELQKFKGFECKDRVEIDLQMQKLQCFCEKLEEKLEETKVEITQQDSIREMKVQQHLNEKGLLETQTATLREELIKQKESSKSLLSDIDKYKDIVNNLTKNIQNMKRELEKYRKEKNPRRCEDMIQEIEHLNQEMRERNCEIANLRTTLDDYNRCSAVAPIGGQDLMCTGTFSQIPFCQETNACTMNQLQKLTDDMKNTQSKIAGIVNRNQEYSCLLQRRDNNHNCLQSQQYAACPAQSQQQRHVCQQGTADKFSSLRDRVQDKKQKEELQYLLKVLQHQNDELTDFNNKRQCNDLEIEHRLAKIKYKKDAVEAVIKDYQNAQNEISRGGYGACENSYSSKSPIKSESPERKAYPKTKEAINSETTSVSNSALLHSYQSQLEKSVTKYKDVEDVKQNDFLNEEQFSREFDLKEQVNGNTEEVNRPSDYITEAPEDYKRSNRPIAMARTDSLNIERQKLPTKVKLLGIRERSTEAPLKIFHDKYLLDSNVRRFHIKCKSSPIPIFSDQLEGRRLEPLHFNSFYSKVPSLMFAQRQASDRLVILTEYKVGMPTLTGGPLKCPYRFWQLYFQWGSDDSYGSEHSVNDKRFVMEMHAIHIKENITVEQAMKHPDGFVILAYLYTYSSVDDDDIAMSSIIQNFQRFDLRPDENYLEFQSYFPLDLLMRPFTSQYVTYRDSLAEGSDNENVIWIIAPFVNMLSRGQMTDLRNLMSQVSSSAAGPLLKHAPNKPTILAETLEGQSDRRNSLTSNNLFSKLYVL